MLTEDGKHLYVSWDEYHMLIERLALKVAHSGWVFDQILCLARGGMRPGDQPFQETLDPLPFASVIGIDSDDSVKITVPDMADNWSDQVARRNVGCRRADTRGQRR